MNAVNFIKITENIASSGQPSATDFTEIASLGYDTIINLALTTSDNAIADEGDIVTELGMSYVHIPVQWQQPTLEQFQLFVAVMQQQYRRKVWVHCALNMRVSVFLYLYNTLCLGMAEEAALSTRSQVWQPDEIWSQFIIDVKTACKTTACKT